jgi:hypothetical protein
MHRTTDSIPRAGDVSVLSQHALDNVSRCLRLCTAQTIMGEAHNLGKSSLELLEIDLARLVLDLHQTTIGWISLQSDPHAPEQSLKISLIICKLEDSCRAPVLRKHVDRDCHQGGWYRGPSHAVQVGANDTQILNERHVPWKRSHPHPLR